MFSIFRSTIYRNLKCTSSLIQTRNLCTQITRISKSITNTPIISSRSLFMGSIKTPIYQHRLLHPASILSFRQLSTPPLINKPKPLDLSQDADPIEARVEPTKIVYNDKSSLPSDEELSTTSKIVIGTTIGAVGIATSYVFVKYLLLPAMAGVFLFGWIGIGVLAHMHPLLILAFVLWMMS